MIALEEALQEVRRMSDLVESLFNDSCHRADEGVSTASRARGAGALVQEVYETALMTRRSAGVTVNLPSPQTAVVMGDRTRLRQLFLILS